MASQGYSAGGRPPVGYQAQRVRTGTRPNGKPRYNTIWVPDPARAPDVQAAFEMILAGASYHDVHERYGLTRSDNGLHDLFRNPAYVGWQVYDRRARRSRSERLPRSQWTICESAHEAIVDQDLWDQVQELLDGRQADNHRHRSYLLSGLLVCGLCGAAVTGSRQVKWGQQEYCYYRCSTKYRRGWDACSLPSLRVEVIDAAVLACIRTAILTPTRIRELVDAVNERLAAASSPAHDRLTALERQRASLEQRRDHILDAIEQLGVDAGDVAERLADLTVRQKRAEQELDALERQLANLRPLAVTPAQIRDLITDFQVTLSTAPLAERQELLRSFVQQIEIWPDHGQIEYLPPVFQRESWCRGGDTIYKPTTRWRHLAVCRRGNPDGLPGDKAHLF